MIRTRDLMQRKSAHCFYCNVQTFLYHAGWLHKGKKTGRHPHNAASKDHLFAKSKGGRNSLDNLVIACMTCNAFKGDMSVEQFEQSRFLRKRIEYVLHMQNYK